MDDPERAIQIYLEKTLFRKGPYRKAYEKSFTDDPEKAREMYLMKVKPSCLVNRVSLHDINYRRVIRNIREFLEEPQATELIAKLERGTYNFAGPENRKGLKTLGKRNLGNLSHDGIGCFNGVLITPSGLYNVKDVKHSDEYPTGLIITPIQKEDFGVIKLVEDGLKGWYYYEKLTLD